MPALNLSGLNLSYLLQTFRTVCLIRGHFEHMARACLFPMFVQSTKNSKLLKIPWTAKMGWLVMAAIFHLYYFPSLRLRSAIYCISLMKSSQRLLLVFFRSMRYLLCRLTASPMFRSIHQRESLRSSVGVDLKKILAWAAFPVHKSPSKTVCRNFWVTNSIYQ